MLYAIFALTTVYTNNVSIRFVSLRIHVKFEINFQMDSVTLSFKTRPNLNLGVFGIWMGIIVKD